MQLKASVREHLSKLRVPELPAASSLFHVNVLQWCGGAALRPFSSSLVFPVTAVGKLPFIRTCASNEIPISQISCSNFPSLERLDIAGSVAFECQQPLSTNAQRRGSGSLKAELSCQNEVYDCQEEFFQGLCTLNGVSLVPTGCCSPATVLKGAPGTDTASLVCAADGRGPVPVPPAFSTPGLTAIFFALPVCTQVPPPAAVSCATEARACG